MRTPSLVFFVSLVSACAVTHETTAAQVQLDESVARTQASALTSAISGANADDGVTVADALARIGDTASALVPETKGGAGHRPGSGATSCTCEASAKRCDFDGCTIRGATVSGSIAWGDGRISCTDLVVDVSTGAATAHATLGCDLGYDASHLAGTVRTTGTATTGGTTYAWDATLTAEGITVASGTVTAGSLAASATVSVTSAKASSAAKQYAATAVVSLP